MLGDIAQGAAQFGMSFVGGRKRLARRDAAKGAYDQSRQKYFGQDTSNLYSNLENTMEDLTVNTQAADFAAEQQAQGLSNIMGSMNQAAGGSGIAALAQSLANQQSQSAQRASASIGQQEQRNQMAAAGQAGRLQSMERMGAEQSRELKSSLLGEGFQIDAGELSTAENQILAAQKARMEGVGQMIGGIGTAVGVGLGGDGDFFENIGEASFDRFKNGY